ncbi:unnamed protein product [Lactuca virosa]|uniref:Uncharacterized protein n=1 Tax=Lactuca virosa TaxID=75947 RepID=A0AAU9NQI7_9ASTR|nr:unnamed protein product [Lactuca virosa]
MLPSLPLGTPTSSIVLKVFQKLPSPSPPLHHCTYKGNLNQISYRIRMFKNRHIHIHILRIFHTNVATNPTS